MCGAPGRSPQDALPRTRQPSEDVEAILRSTRLLHDGVVSVVDGLVARRWYCAGGGMTLWKRRSAKVVALLGGQELPSIGQSNAHQRSGIREVCSRQRWVTDKFPEATEALLLAPEHLNVGDE